MTITGVKCLASHKVLCKSRQRESKEVLFVRDRLLTHCSREPYVFLFSLARVLRPRGPVLAQSTNHSSAPFDVNAHTANQSAAPGPQQQLARWKRLETSGGTAGIEVSKNGIKFTEIRKSAMCYED